MNFLIWQSIDIFVICVVVIVLMCTNHAPFFTSLCVYMFKCYKMHTMKWLRNSKITSNTTSKGLNLTGKDEQRHQLTWVFSHTMNVFYKYCCLMCKYVQFTHMHNCNGVQSSYELL